MSRYILRYDGKGTPPPPDLNRIHDMTGVEIVDESPCMLLVDATESALAELGQMPSWIIAPEKMVPLPDTRKKPTRSP
jgi:hypothetical protein